MVYLSPGATAADPIRHPGLMTSPQIHVQFLGGPFAGRTDTVQQPVLVVHVPGHDSGAYVLDGDGVSYGWHVPAPALHRPRRR